MPKLTDEDRQHARDLGKVLVALRERAGMTRDDAELYLGVPLSTLGKWERGENAPKGYALGQLYLKYKPYGADPEWFLNPPQSVVVDPVKDRLDALEATGAISAAEREERVAERRRRNAAKRAGGRGRRSA